MKDWINGIAEGKAEKDEFTKLDEEIDGSIGNLRDRKESWLGHPDKLLVPIFEFRNLESVFSKDNGFVDRVGKYEEEVVALHKLALQLK